MPKLKIHRYKLHDIEEFDSLDELRAFDTEYVNNTGCKILQDICSSLHCEEKDIVDIKALKKGMTASLFEFRCLNDGQLYTFDMEQNSFVDRK